MATQLKCICSIVENKFSITSGAYKSICSIVEVMKSICNILKVKNDFELYMKVIDIFVVKENRDVCCIKRID